jgi:hypothetical protein
MVIFEFTNQQFLSGVDGHGGDNRHVTPEGRSTPRGVILSHHPAALRKNTNQFKWKTASGAPARPSAGVRCMTFEAANPTPPN